MYSTSTCNTTQLVDYEYNYALVFDLNPDLTITPAQEYDFSGGETFVSQGVLPFQQVCSYQYDIGNFIFIAGVIVFLMSMIFFGLIFNSIIKK